MGWKRKDAGIREGGPMAPSNIFILGEKMSLSKLESRKERAFFANKSASKSHVQDFSVYLCHSESTENPKPGKRK